MMETKKISDIYCADCGAPAVFDIVSQQYLCSHCGSRTQIDEALEQKRGFRKIRSEALRQEAGSFELFHAVCQGCGADIVFQESEALSSCPFCGRNMVRNEYLHSDDMPESVIPFAITESEAKELLRKWCASNRTRPEAKKLLKHTDELKGFYLPYELLKGPVHMTVSRMDGLRKYHCEGFINDELVNRSKQLDDLLLDGMEPFDIDGLKEFDFGYVAGQHVKIADIDEKQLSSRIEEGTGDLYRSEVGRVLESRAVDIDTDVTDAIRLPVLLPVYHICSGDLMAAVNGQTGKVAVRSMKDSHYYFIPWWIKAVISTIAFSLILFTAFRLFGLNNGSSLYLCALLAFFFIIVTLCLYSDTVHNSFRVVSGRKIFSSGESSFKREYGELVLSDEILRRKVVRPVFFEEVRGKKSPVELKFTTPFRILKMTLLCLLVIFLPVLLALLINGFDFEKLSLGGSAAWFCIFVPVVPIYLLKFGIVELHDRPLIYLTDRKGRKRRYRRRPKISIDKQIVGDILRALFIPPMSLLTWFCILGFIVMVYLTAGYE